MDENSLPFLTQETGEVPNRRKFLELKERVMSYNNKQLREEDDSDSLEVKRKIVENIYNVAKVSENNTTFNSTIIEILVRKIGITNEDALSRGRTMGIRGSSLYCETDYIQMGNVILIEKFFLKAKKIIAKSDSQSGLVSSSDKKSCVIQ